MSNSQVKKITLPAIKALKELNIRVLRKRPSEKERQERLLSDAKASVAIEHPHLHGNNA